MRFAIVAPTYNHARTLKDVLHRLGGAGVPVIVVDDGSRDETAETVTVWAEAGAERLMVRHAQNRGKAAAMVTGFEAARGLGATHAATIDTDGQHRPEELDELMRAAAAKPEAIVIGRRERRIEGYPLCGRFGRWMSNVLVRLESGVRVSDSQSGMRVYPLDLVKRLGCRTDRYAFETEVLVRAGWAGVPVVEVPITCVYRVESGRVTHFRLGRDSAASLWMHAKLFTRSMLPGRPVPRIGTESTDTTLRRLGRWLSPRGLAALARGDRSDRRRLAASVGVGLFMATVPLYGVKTVVCLALAGVLRLHPLAVVGVSSLSTPPLGFAFAAASIFVGHILMHGTMGGAMPEWGEPPLEVMGRLAVEWIAGSVPVGVALGLAGYGLVRAGLLLRPVNR